MTRGIASEIEYMVSVMTAYAKGKQIQERANIGGKWEDVTPRWDWMAFEYRVKPEEPKDEYRPFKDVDELIAYWEKHYMQSKLPPNTRPLIWVRNKKKKEEWLMYAFCEDEAVYMGGGFGFVRMKDLFDKWTFLDGKPCGVDMSKKDCVTCKHNDDGTADPLNGLCVNCENYNNWEKDA